MSAMPAEAEPRRAPTAPSPVTVRPRHGGLRMVPAAGQPGAGHPAAGHPAAGQRIRPAGPRPRQAGASAHHPTGMRACSAVLRAEPPSAVLGIRLSPPSPRRDNTPGLRLTRRGRVVLALCAAIAATLFGFAAASAAQAADHGAPAGAAGHSLSRIVVQPGQTLWSIAVQADPHADPRLVVQQIMAANSLSEGSLQAGQRLLVPRG